MAAPLFLGVDGGGTATALTLVSADGEVAASLLAPSVYYFSEGIELVTDVLVPAVADLCDQAGTTPSRVAYGFFGLPGYGESSADLPALDAAPRRVLGHDRYRCDNDMVCGWAGSLGGVDGINVISGTGSMTYGEREGRGVRVGGWGELFGDEGSAYWIAVQGLNAFSRMSDGRAEPGPLLEVLREQLGLAADLDLVDVVLNRWGGRRGEVAALCRPVVRAADLGDQAAAAILDRAAGELAELVSVTRSRLGFAEDETVAVSWSGGTFGAARVRDGFRQTLLARHPHTDLRLPALSPVIGAAVHAARLAGTPLASRAVERLVVRALDTKSLPPSGEPATLIGPSTLDRATDPTAVLPALPAS